MCRLGWTLSGGAFKVLDVILFLSPLMILPDIVWRLLSIISNKSKGYLRISFPIFLSVDYE
jgi:hypothetical protein